jgi:hypothetical protein
VNSFLVFSTDNLFTQLVIIHLVLLGEPFIRLTKNTKIKIHITIILPVVFYGCKTWSITLREERRLRVFQNRVLRRIFGPKRD